MPNEQEQAQISLSRGRTAAGIKDPVEKKRFIGRQGAGKMSTAELVSEDTKEKARQAIDETMSGKRSNPGTGVVMSYDTGGVVHEDGAYKLKKGETVSPAPARGGFWHCKEDGTIVFRETEKG